MKTTEEKLNEVLIRADQSHRDGKLIVSIPTFVYVIRLILKLIKEK